MEHLREDDPDLNELLLQFDQTVLDLILVEGFRDYPFAKIELYRDTSREPQYLMDSQIIAVATDVDSLTATIPILDINDPWMIADFVLEHLQIKI